MQKWIIDDICAVSNTLNKRSLKNFKVIFAINREVKSSSEGVGIVNVDSSSLESIRDSLLYADFLLKVKFPFLVYGSLSSLKEYSLKLLIFIGEKSAKVIKKLEKIFESPLISFGDEVKEFEKTLPLYKLPEPSSSFYLTNEMVKTLRKKCPWDREQTHESLIPELVEEPLELAEAIKRKDYNGMNEELGDVLLQILFHAVLGEEEKKFDIETVSKTLFEKMHERHPHVFSGVKARNSSEVLENWENIKKKKHKDKTESISKILASFITSADLQLEARENGLDFSSVEQIEEKIIEELKELKTARKNDKKVQEELGDLLFSAVNLARFLNIDPAHALFISMEKFRRRFQNVKSRAGELTKLSEKELDKLWEEAKKNENS